MHPHEHRTISPKLKMQMIQPKMLLTTMLGFGLFVCLFYHVKSMIGSETPSEGWGEVGDEYEVGTWVKVQGTMG